MRVIRNDEMRFRPKAELRRPSGPRHPSLFLPESVVALLLLLLASSACGPPSSQSSGQTAPGSSTAPPELTDETIRERIRGVFIRKVPEENGNGKPINWTFFDDEPKDITVVEKQIDGPRATLILDIKTGSSPRATKRQFAVAGRIKTDWQLETGWVLRRWQIVNAENISLKYRLVSGPPVEDSDR